MGRTLLNLIACQLASGSGRFAAIMKSGLALSLVFVANVLVGAEIKSIHKLSGEERAARLLSDARATTVYREGLSNVIAFVKQFDAQFVTRKHQFDLVKFLDGSERSKSAREATLEDFRVSWKRPKWHVLVQQ